MQKEENDLRERTKQFALRIIRMFGALPKTTKAQILGKQVLRSGTSVGANYREAYQGRSKAEFIAKAGDCLREIEETGYWLELLVEAGIVPAEKLAPLRRECGELIAIFVTIVRKAEGKSIGELTEARVGQRGPSGRGEFTYVDISSIDRETKRIVDPKVLPAAKAPSRAKQVLKAGDMLVSMTRPNLNAVAIVPPDLNGSIGSTGFHILRGREAESGFLFYAVQTPDFIDVMCMNVQGALYSVRPGPSTACSPPAVNGGCTGTGSPPPPAPICSTWMNASPKATPRSATASARSKPPAPANSFPPKPN